MDNPRTHENLDSVVYGQSMDTWERGDVFLYKVREVAQICGVTDSAVYKVVRKLLSMDSPRTLDGQVGFEDGQSTDTTDCNGQSMDTPYLFSDDGVTYITDEGLEYFKQRFVSASVHQPPANDELVASLLKQLENRDKQLEEKDKQIATLMEQARNYQVLLKQEQDSKLLLLEQPKKVGWFRRLFGRNDTDE